jgi:uracil-DNA glycosylase
MRSVDARDQLRRYLEQRREMGETDLILDAMTVDETLRILGAKTAARSGSSSPPDTPANTLTNPLASKVASRPAAAPKSEASEQPSNSSEAGDWRETLRATGAGPGAPAASFSPTTAAGSAADSVAALDSLEAIAAHVASCTRCPLHSTAKHPVPGEGNAHAELMCVGEAPGATEDETGRPFVGAAGQLLTKILEAISLPREQVYICNVLKHRPPGNRNPLPEEVTACSPYLIRQIELIKPKVIIALGSFAAQTLLKTTLTIGKLRGQIHQYHGVPLVVTYHPAALLRNPAWKRPTWEDVQLARRILDSSSPGA